MMTETEKERSCALAYTLGKACSGYTLLEASSALTTVLATVLRHATENLPDAIADATNEAFVAALKDALAMPLAPDTNLGNTGGEVAGGERRYDAVQGTAANFASSVDGSALAPQAPMLSRTETEGRASVALPSNTPITELTTSIVTQDGTRIVSKTTGSCSFCGAGPREASECEDVRCMIG